MGTVPPAWFVGDLDEPWVRSIAEALPRRSFWTHAPGPLPRTSVCAGVWVIHRTHLTEADRLRLADWRSTGRADGSAKPRVVLVVGPFARSRDLERWNLLVDAIVPEATAAESIARQVPGVVRRPPPRSQRPTVQLVVEDFAWRCSLAEILRAGGYPVQPLRQWPEPPAGLVVWDVPVLSETWRTALSRATPGANVVALIGFADRGLVTEARAAGATACLDSTCDPEDLIFVIDRIAGQPIARLTPVTGSPAILP